MQIGADLLLRTGAVARGVEIVKPQIPFAASEACIQPAQESGSQVASVESTAGGGSKTPPDPLGSAVKSGSEQLDQMIRESAQPPEQRRIVQP
jgi:hypothetical protein